MISIIIPVIRPDSFMKCEAAIEKNSDGIEYEIVTGVDHSRIGVAKMVKSLLKDTDYDLVMFLGDDTVPQPGFLTEALNAMECLPDGWGMVALDDGRNKPKEGTHFLIHKKMLPLIGGEIFHTGYIHCFCDTELSLRARLLGRFAYAHDAKIKHNHPVLDKSVKSDADYERVYSKEVWTHDEQLWRQRRELIIKEHERTKKQGK